MPLLSIVRVCITVLIASLCGCAALPQNPATLDAEMEPPSAAVELVTRRIASYNAHDIESLLATYAQDVRIYVYPERFLGQGRERLRRIFGPQFARGDGHIVVRGQSALEDKVVSVEDVTIAAASERNIAIYTVRHGLITEVRLIEPGE
jgi:hypothetical protein